MVTKGAKKRGRENRTKDRMTEVYHQKNDAVICVTLRSISGQTVPTKEPIGIKSSPCVTTPISRRSIGDLRKNLKEFLF